MNAYQLENLRFRYKHATSDALKGVTWTIAAGACYGLLGPNGAGKTTLMRLLCGDMTPSSGSIRLFEDPLAKISRHRIGLVPQELAIYDDFSAEENLFFWGRLYGLTASELKERVPKMLNRLGLTDRRKDSTADFSGGMKRRLNFGCGLLHDPDVILLDEPTVGVDPQSRNHLFELIEELVASGKTVIYSTHYMEEAERLCRDIAIIDQGTILAHGNRSELIAKSELPTQLILSFSTPADTLQASQNPKLTTCGSIQTEGSDLIIELTVTLVEALEAASLTGYTSLQIKRPTLESLFLHLTGRSLRE